MAPLPLLYRFSIVLRFALLNNGYSISRKIRDEVL